MLHPMKYFTLLTFTLLFFLSLAMTALAAPPPTAQRLIQYKTEGGLYGYMDISGKVVIEPQFDYAYEFIEGLALVSQKGKYGYIDETGAWVIPLQFKNARDFVDGLALVDTGVGKNSTAYIDKTGKIVIPSGEIYYGSSFQEGFAMISVKDKWGFIDKTGQVVIQPQYDKAEDFSEGLAAVITAGKTGYIDVTDKMVIAPQFDVAHSFLEGLARVSLNQKVGFIDKTGKIVIQLQTDQAGDFHEGLAWLSIDDKVGYMDKTGQIVIQPQFVYPYAYNFSEGLASVKIGDRYGYIDKTGQIVIPPIFKMAGMFEHGLGFVLNEMSEGYIDANGNIIIQTPLSIYSRPHTQIIPFIPALPTKTQAGTCSTHSLIVNQPFAWRCTTDDNMLHDPCLLAGDGKTLVCDADPTQSHSGFAVTLAKPLPTPTPPTTGPKLTRKVLENTTYLLYDMELMTATLKDGRFEEKYGTGESEKITYTLLNKMGYGDINGDGLEDAVVVLVMDGGGSGKFVYLVVVINDNGQPKQVATSLLGDRVLINSVTIYNQSVTVDMITQGPGESFPSPSQRITVQYVLQGSDLQAEYAPQWFMQMEDGSVCNSAIGAGALGQDKRLNYACTDKGKILGEVNMNDWDAHTFAWTVEKDIVTNTNKTQKLKVNAAWQPVDPLQLAQEMGLSPQAVTMTLGQVAQRLTGQIRPMYVFTSSHDLQGEPAHLHFTFDNGTLPSWGGLDLTQPQLLIYAYQNIYASLGNEKVGQRMALLQTLLATRPTAISETLPIVSNLVISPMLTAQVKYLDFKQGSGIRFITYYTQSVSSRTNTTLFYTFQGITKDNKYYISYFSPITTSVLANKADADMVTYLAETQQTLNNTTDFTPTLTSLDTMLQSLQLEPK